MLLKKFTDVTQKDLLLKKKEKGVLSLDEEAQLERDPADARPTRRSRPTGTDATASITKRRTAISSWLKTFKI